MISKIDNTVDRALGAEVASTVEITNMPDHVSETVRSELLDLQDRLGKVKDLITLVEYALEGMSGDDHGSISALQTGMSAIREDVIAVSILMAEIRARE